MFTLFGNGVSDDTLAIQEMLDSGAAEVVLPAPEKCYLISKTLKIHANQTLRMAPTTVIRLADDSNCSMIENVDFGEWADNVCVDGGIWDFNNVGQEPNPYHFPGKDGKKFYGKLGITDEYKSDFDFREKVFPTYTQLPNIYTGFSMRFCRVRNLTLKNITYRNPVTYGVQIAYIDGFTIRDIIFDYHKCNPKWWNMDGVHVEGNCKNGYINNLKGTVHDDLVALTSDDSLYGPIENVVIDGLFAEHAHSAVRLLSWGIPVKNITIKNVFGSYYVYVVGITRYFGGDTAVGKMENIVIDGMSVCGSEGTVDVKGGGCPLIWVQDGLDIDGLTIKNVYRDEATSRVPMIGIDKRSTVKRLVVDNVVQKNRLDGELPFSQIDGEVDDYQHGFAKEYKL
jgi:polygalacturonase